MKRNNLHRVSAHSLAHRMHVIPVAISHYHIVIDLIMCLLDLPITSYQRAAGPCPTQFALIPVKFLVSELPRFLKIMIQKDFKTNLGN